MRSMKIIQGGIPGDSIPKIKKDADRLLKLLDELRIEDWDTVLDQKAMDKLTNYFLLKGKQNENR